MREIKFRQFVDGEFRYWGYGVMPDEAKFVSPVTSSNGDVYPSQQYTGLNDKNGVKIYEGDIVEFEPLDFCIGTVKFGEWSNRDRLDVGVTTISGWYIEYDWYLQYGAAYKARTESLAHHEVQVVGNIYEHANLLEIN